MYNLIKKYIPSARLVSDNREILIRCRYCNDSDNPNHAHMYISNNDLLEYHCKKCGASGRVTKSKLISWGIIDYELLKRIKNNQHMYTHSNKNYFVRNCPNLSFVNNSLALKKINYINERLGLNITMNDVIENKIVLNLKDLLSVNNITSLTRKPNIVTMLNENYIGFLSYDNSSINMRNIVSNEYRYINYTLFNDNIDSSGKFYIIPTNIEINKLTRIHIAEGPFDILGAKYNVAEFNPNYNDIFIAIRGISYQTVISFILQEIGIIHPIFHIYLDNGIKQYVTQNIINILKHIPCELYFLRNKYLDQKDFGVPKSFIDLDTQKIF